MEDEASGFRRYEQRPPSRNVGGAGERGVNSFSG